ncbi:Tyrosine-protein phosphatase Lar-like protein, partial [Leptotrombidium deliense]
MWEPPPPEKHNGVITHYKINYAKIIEDDKTDYNENGIIEDDVTKVFQAQVGPNERSIVLKGLEEWTNYNISVLAGTVIGDGPPSNPLILRTDEAVPGEPRNVKVTAINSTSVKVEWKPPLNKEQNGLIRGYQIHVQEVNKAGDYINDALRYDVADGNAEEFNVTKLQPDT